jgi:demethylmenaquinone methyltransferase/2-methoxy-6-polyprenyl-1,4-benzoquinol methylase
MVGIVPHARAANFHFLLKLRADRPAQRVSLPTVSARLTDRTPWTAQGEEKREAVRRMFAQIAPSYDRMNGLMSLRLHRRWRQIAVDSLGLPAGATVLDLCCGTGDFLVPLRRAVGPQGRVFAGDFCLPMLDRAREKDDSAALALADAGQLPYASDTFDAVTVGWGIRNVPDVDRVHGEIARVLRSGGTFVSLDMARPRNRLFGSASEWVFHRLVPLLGQWMGHAEAYRYLPESTRRFMTREELAESMTRAGFAEVAWRDLFFGNVCLHRGRKP